MKVLFVATVQSHIAQFHLKIIEVLKQKGWEIHVAARDNLAEKNGLQLKNVDKVYNILFQRSPFSPKNLKAYRELKKVITGGKYDIIHCNTPVGGILTRIAGRKEKGKVFYTAHGFHFYKGAPLLNWFIYYPIEKVMAHYTDKLITITDEDYHLAKLKFKCPVYRIHGVGINTEKYELVTSKECNEIRKKESLTDKIVILCTGELNKNKNQKVLIIAMQEVLKKIPDAVLLLAGNGPEKDNLVQLIKHLKLENQIRLLGYRTDLQKYVHMSDIIVSASFREGLPLNIVEGMFCSKPIVASRNRGHLELVSNDVNGFLVSPEKADEFADKLIYLCKHPDKRKEMGIAGYQKSIPYWDNNVLKELKKIYW